jgi:predicted phage terminase large subunit-like protein
VGIDECVSVPFRQALFMFSRLRRLTGSRIPPRFRCASNPPTEAEITTGSWVKDRYVDPTTRGDRVFIPSWLEDNPYIDAEDYLKSLAELDPVTREQLRHGDWEIQAKGFMFQRQWFPLVDEAPADVPRWLRWWDLAATEENAAKARARGHDPDWTAGGLVGVDRQGITYIKDIRRVRLSPANVETLVAQTADLDGRPVIIWMEQEPGASGKATCSHFARNVVPGYAFYYEPSTGSKVEYARPMAAAAERGEVRLVRGPWVKDFLEESDLFPFGPHDDMIDATSKARAKLTGRRRRAGTWGPPT